MDEIRIQPANFYKNTLSLSASVFVYPDSNINRFHSHNYFQFNYIRKGTAIHQCMDQCQELNEGDYFIIAPGVLHSVYAKGGPLVEAYGIDFALDSLYGKSKELNRVESDINLDYLDHLFKSGYNLITGRAVSDQLRMQLEYLLEKIVNDSVNDKERYLLLRSRFLSLLAVLTLDARYIDAKDNEDQAETSYDKVRQSIEYINQNYTKDISFEDVCKITNLSPSYYRRIFKDISDKTYSKYITDLRINKALTMLSTTNESVKEIYSKCGFRDVTHFYKTFKDCVGLSPQEYRKSKLK